MVLVIRKKTRPQEVCINPTCKSKTNPEEKKQIQNIEQNKVERKCPKCGKVLVLRRSFYGQFLGCPGYPKCKHAENLDGTQGFKKKTAVKEEKE